MKIGTITLPKTAMLAPMAGVTDRAFREICMEMGSAYVIGEMASSKGIFYNSEKSAELLSVSDRERPMAVQLFGDEPETMAYAAKVAEGFSPDAIDINMGCPAPKVTGNNSGSALLKNLPLAEEIIRATVQATALPVTVKFRSGWDDNSVNGVEMAQRAERAGAVALCIHGRTRAQMYTPPVNYSIMAQVKAAVSIPVIANGDVVDIPSAEKLYEETDCDLIMVGRGAMGNPWIFAQLKAYFEDGISLPPPSDEEKMTVLLEQIRRACEYKGEYIALREARSHAGWYLKGMQSAASLRKQAGQLSTYEDLVQLTKDALDAQVAGRL